MIIFFFYYCSVLQLYITSWMIQKQCLFITKSESCISKDNKKVADRAFPVLLMSCSEDNESELVVADAVFSITFTEFLSFN